MQINYDNYEDLRYAPYWNAAQIYNASQAVDVPPVYAPYGVPGFWKAGIPPYVNPMAPNSGANLTVGAAMMASNSPGRNVAPPPNVKTAIATGQGIGPISLVSPLPSITAVPNPANPQSSCSFNSWVSQNPGLAALGAFGVFLLLKGGKRR